MESYNPYILVIVAVVAGVMPIAVGLLTSYLKVSIVFGMIKSALGAQNVPGPVATMALSLSTSLIIMAPILERTTELGKKLDTKSIMTGSFENALEKLSPLVEPLEQFLVKHTGDRERAAIEGLLAREKAPVFGPAPAPAPVPDPTFSALIPGFILTEIREAFMMSFLLLLPFLVVDLVVSNILAGLGMSMVSPTIITLPLKLLLFVLADGWLLLTQSLVQSYA